MEPPSSSHEYRTFGHGLIVAFVLLILCFVASTFMAMHLAQGISTDSESIANNAAPSVLALASARTELRRLEVGLDDYVERPEPVPYEAQQLEGSLRALDAELDQYFALPQYAGENSLWPPVETQRRVLRDAVQRALHLAATDHLEATRLADTVVKPTVERLDDALRAISLFNASRASEIALNIVYLRNRTRNVMLLADVASAVLGFVLLVLLMRRLGYTARVIQSQQRTLEARAREMEDFSGRVAHDIRGPLQSLGLALELAQRNTAERVPLEMLERARRSLRRVRNIVDGLYEFARSSTKPSLDTHCDASEVLADLLDEFQGLAEHDRVELRYEARAQSEAACSAGVLSSIVGNLVQNALKYIGDGATRCITVRMLEAGPSLRFEVEDTGPGIPAPLQDFIFEPHARAPGTAQPGLGLGLATVKRLALAHGGTVGLRSEPGQGATFWVEMPKYPRT